MSDKPQLFSSRGTQWNIDDYVEKDVPAIIRFVLKETHAQQVHFLGHSMVSDWGTARHSTAQHDTA
jgi:predicted alpha/beta hydrolase